MVGGEEDAVVAGERRLEDAVVAGERRDGCCSGGEEGRGGCCSGGGRIWLPGDAYHPSIFPFP